jgi:hypothetical protein
MTTATATATATATVTAPVQSAMETRQWMAVIVFPVYDPEFGRVVHEDYAFGPYPVLVGPGEPYRAEAMARMNLPEGHELQRWYPAADPADFCEF